MELGYLNKIENLRKVWRNEAIDFTPWLAEEDNMNILADTIGVEISEMDTEVQVGGFNADIIAKETETDRVIVIENQLEDTDHDHLGKIITYASGTDANIIIWIVKNAREEHKKAIEWLNENIDESIDFFLIQIELWQIGDSNPAPRFNILQRPNTWVKEIRKTSKEMSDTMIFKLNYWTAFSEYVFEDQDFSRLFNKRKPNTDHWYDLGAGSSEFHFSFLLNTKRNVITVSCYINNNKELYNYFYSHKEKVENIIGAELDWRELPDKKSSRILIEKSVDLKNEDRWIEQFDWMKEMGIKFYEAFKSLE